MSDCEEVHLAELELMEAAYGDDYTLLDGTPGNIRFSIAISSNNLKAVASFKLGDIYPNNVSKCSIDALLPRAIVQDMNFVVQSAVEEEPTISSMDLCQRVHEYLEDFSAAEETKQHSLRSNKQIDSKELKIARFLIFFHHIMR
mmetsp:Transcript_31563/g.53264  ORF Transcript_31563/g.53264 Transcript_31563/m.53264 type:complete len:144 (-) Transcript_31563:1195-1626(-)